MGYVQDNLMPGEKVIFTASVYPLVVYIGFLPLVFSVGFLVFLFYSLASSSSGQASLIFPLFLGFLFFFYSIMVAIRAILIFVTTEFAVTNKRIIAKRGFIRRHTLEILLPKVESITVHQSILGRILNFGTVTVIGTGGTRESFKSIFDPVGVRRKITQIIERSTQVYAERQAVRLEKGF